MRCCSRPLVACAWSAGLIACSNTPRPASLPRSSRRRTPIHQDATDLLYWLLYQKLFTGSPHFSAFRIFRYLTFRTTFASLTRRIRARVIGPAAIRSLREFQIGQYIREEGP